MTTTVSHDALQQDRQELDGIVQKACIGSRRRCRAVDPRVAFRPHLARILSTVPFAFSFASEALILLQQLRVGLAHADADRADDGRLVALDQAHFGERALLQVVGDDRLVGEAGLDAAGVHVAQDVRDGVVDLDVG